MCATLLTGITLHSRQVQGVPARSGVAVQAILEPAEAAIVAAGPRPYAGTSRIYTSTELYFFRPSNSYNCLAHLPWPP